MNNEQETLADRIRKRLEVVRKSAAAVSLEAGLGRSAVQDILAGNSASPRLDTIQKLTGPLQCSLNYLVSGTELEGSTDRASPFRDLSLHPVIRDLESGVFRTRTPLKHQSVASLEWAYEKAVDEETYAVASDLRLPDLSIWPYRLRDRSLEQIGFRNNDILLAASGFGEQLDLKPGQIVVVERSLHNERMDEWTARMVEESGDGFRLTAKSQDPTCLSFDIPSATTFGSENTYTLNDREWVTIRAIVTAIHRQLPIV